MSKNVETGSGQEAQGDRVIDSYIQKAVDAGEIDPGEFNSGGRSIFWDRNTIRAAVIGVIVLVVVNMVFFYTMRIDESDNTTQWELSKRDFLIEYRESRMEPDNQASYTPNTDLTRAESEEGEGISQTSIEVADSFEAEIDSLENASSEESEYLDPLTSEQEVTEITEVVLLKVDDVPQETTTGIIEKTYVPEQSTGEMAAADEANIRDFVLGWAQSWSFQNIDDYLSHYSEEFISQGGAPFGPWSEMRAERLLVPEWIHVIVDDMRILVDQDLAVAEFIQVYSASNYTDDSRKTLVLKNESGQWKILEETSAPLD